MLTTTRAVNEDALEPCSACSTMSVSISAHASALGASPLSMWRKFAAWPRSARAATGSRPWRMWWCAVTIIGTCEVSRMPLRRVASSVLSPVSGSNAASAETAVRSTSIGCESFTARMTSWISPGSVRASFSAASKASRAARLGSSPWSRR